jgi:hypothetical protein
MIYCRKIQLRCELQIRQFAIEDINCKLPACPVFSQIKIRHTLSEDLLNIINAELDEYGIPKIEYVQSYIRPKKNFQGIHIDGNQSQIIKSAINIPLKGCENSYHIWYHGSFNTLLANHGKNNPYHRIVWDQDPIEAHREEILSATLLRVDQPHSALANDSSDRWIFTMRFKGNPEFETLIDKVIKYEQNIKKPRA